MSAPPPVAGEVRTLFAPEGEFFLIAGPCVLEDDALNLRVGEHLAQVSDELRLPILYKASFDKANRSSLASGRGPGLEEGLERLARVRSETGLPLLTDVHEPAQCGRVAEVVPAPANDVLELDSGLSLPLVEACVREVDLEAGRIVVSPGFADPL